MRQILIERGKVLVEDVPVPQVEPGTVLVKVEYSCISPGTELSGIKESSLSLRERIFKQPDNLKKVWQVAKSQGIAGAWNLVETKLLDAHPLGYSACGLILEVGQGIQDLQPGLRIACAGSQCAYHAEIIRVPRNLAVLVPDNLESKLASTVALGAIALQGIRRLNPTLGEIFVVLGLGAIGQIIAQLLKINGCRVIGVDLESNRIQLAQQLGMEYSVNSTEGNEIDAVLRLTDGIGADGVVITASTKSDAVISSAFKMCRKKARVVLIGDVGLNLNRTDFYQKELDFFISTSYGPGRYDNIYEEKGLDYPLAYVRWTENRNLQEYVRLSAEGKLKIAPLISTVCPVEQASLAYESLQEKDKPPITLLSYAQTKSDLKLCRLMHSPTAKPAGKKQIRIAVIGAGNFAKSTHLPNLKALSDKFYLQAIISRNGHNAVNVAKRFGAKFSGTDYLKVLVDPELDAVLIATRHNLHASMVLDSLKAGKHVFVEKPLVLDEDELNKIKDYYESAKSTKDLPLLLTGFNRRFSCYALRIQECIRKRTSPMIMNYRFNARYIPQEHWIHSEEGGGRNIGEACHIYDLFTFFTNSRVVSIDAQKIKPATDYYSGRDNFVTTLTFADGSVGTLAYTSLGNSQYPKEYLEIFVDGKVIVLDDYKRLDIFGSREKGMVSRVSKKGFKEELEAFATVIQEGGDWPIPFWQQVQTTEIAFKAEKKLLSQE